VDCLGNIRIPITELRFDDFLKRIHLVSNDREVMTLTNFSEWCQLTKESRIAAVDMNGLYNKFREYGWLPIA